MQFSNIVISGGAMKAFSSIGCIRYLEEIDVLKYIRNYLGTSAGSLLCLFLVLGFSSKEITTFLTEQFKRRDVIELNVDEALLLFENYGLTSGANLTKFINEMLLLKTKKHDITFLELAKTTGKNLIVCVANITEEKEEYWSVDTTPNMSVVFAIRASCSLPLIFTPINYKGNIYIDGGIYNNFPIDYFKTDVIKDVIGINILTKSKSEVKDLLSYITVIINTTIKHLVKPYNDDLKNNVVTLELQDEAWISFSNMTISLPEQLLEQYILLGYNEMKKKLEILTCLGSESFY